MEREADLLERVRACRLYAYRLPAETFRPHDMGGYRVTGPQVEATERIVVSDLLGRPARARIELRITPLHLAILAARHQLNGGVQRSRLRHAAPGRPAATTEGP